LKQQQQNNNTAAPEQQQQQQQQQNKNNNSNAASTSTAADANHNNKQQQEQQQQQQQRITVVNNINQQQQQQQQVSSLSTVEHTSAAISTVKEILQFATPTWKFRCRVKISGYSPANFANFTRPCCPQCSHSVKQLNTKKCTTCNAEFSAPVFQYIFQLRLQDETGHLDAYLFNDDATRFLGVAPSNLIKSKTNCQQLEQLVRNLINTKDAYLDCCVMSYLTAQQKRVFRIFDTHLNAQ